jgi:hypothetical protein
MPMSPTTLADNEIARLDVLMSEVDRSVRPPLPRYATDIMPAGLSEDEALHRALQSSALHPPPPPSLSFNPWDAPPPSPPLAAPA